MPEAGQGPAVGSVTFNGLHESDNAVDIQNTTSTFTINVTRLGDRRPEAVPAFEDLNAGAAHAAVTDH